MAFTGITIVLELDRAADSPSGSARLLDGSRRTFHGWLGLAEAIDSLAAMATASPGAGSNARTAGDPLIEGSPS